MQATSLRVRFGPTIEWLVAAVFLAATLAVGLLLVREFRATPAAVPAPALSEPTAGGPPSVPERAVSVPALLLMDGSQVRIGDSAEQVAKILGGAAEVGTPVKETGPLGPRTIHSYERQGTRFLLVFEPFERKGPPRVAGIYLQ
jgi:hypothetical protein